MATESTTDNQGSSTRPYLLRALHDWCTDNGFTPYLAVYVDDTVQVPREHVKNNEIVLNVAFEATSGLKLGNEQVEFRARFGGVSRDIVVPVDHVVAIYARENGQGMAFPVPTAAATRGAPLGASTGGAGSAPRTLRLAPVPGAGVAAASDAGDAASPPSAVLHQVPASAEPEAPAVPAPADVGVDGEAEEPPEPPPAPPRNKGSRPSLKRIK